jgi:hypothetical protein
MQTRLGRPSTKVDRTCPICSLPFKAKPSEIARGSGRYCSFRCSDEAKRRDVVSLPERNRRKPQVERTCETCLATFLVYPYRATAARPARFCSTPCRMAPPNDRRGAKV